MSNTVEHLNKILGDLKGNRARLAEQIAATKLQLEVNETQITHFDSIIAATRHALSDPSVVAKIDELKNQPFDVEEDENSSLDSAGAGAEAAPASATEDDCNEPI